MSYDYIILLCADKKGPNGRFPDLRNGDYIGGENKMEAALKFSLENPEPTFIIAGGFDENSEKSQKVDDMVSYLKEGNPEIKIIAIPTLSCIRHNFIAIFNKLGEELRNKRVAIIQTFAYLPRTMAIYTKLAETEFPYMPMLHIICAESLVNNEDFLSENSKPFLKRICREQDGLFDLEAGNYVDFCLDKKKDCFIGIAKTLSYLTTDHEKEKYQLDLKVQV